MTHPLRALNAGRHEQTLFAPKSKLCDHCGIALRRTEHKTARRVTTYLGDRYDEQWLCLDATACAERGAVPTTIEELIADRESAELVIAAQADALRRLRRRLARKHDEIDNLKRELRTCTQGDD